MEPRGNDGDHTRKEEAGHPVNDGYRVESRHATHPDSAAESYDDFIDNLEPDRLEEEIAEYWSDPDFLKLVNDSEFRKDVHDACEAMISRFRPSPVYTCDDLEQDVIARFGKWFPKYRGEAQPRSLLRGIAFNQLVDVYRKRDNQCSSYDAIERGCQELIRLRASTNRNHAEARQERAILLKELTGKLTRKERVLFSEYFQKGLTTSEMGDARGVSRQVISKQLTRIANKLRSVVTSPSSPEGDKVTVEIGNSRAI
jgi:RNA polymerase sigma factor (sigma-70 family)